MSTSKRIEKDVSPVKAVTACLIYKAHACFKQGITSKATSRKLGKKTKKKD